MAAPDSTRRTSMPQSAIASMPSRHARYRCFGEIEDILDDGDLANRLGHPCGEQDARGSIQVRGAAGENADRVQTWGERHRAGKRHNAVARLPRCNATAMCRNAQRTAGVGTERKDNGPTGDGSRGALLRPSRDKVEIPGILRRVVHGVVARRFISEFGHCRVADAASAGAIEQVEHGRLLWRLHRQRPS